MTTGTDADKHDKVIEGKVSRRFNDLVLPILLAVVAFFGNRSLTGIEDSQKAQAKQLEQVSSDVRVLNTRMEYSLIEQLKQLQQRMDKFEQATKTP